MTFLTDQAILNAALYLGFAALSAGLIGTFVTGVWLIVSSVR